MKTLTEVIHEVDQLSTEDQEGLATHLLAALKGAPLGPDNAELAKREAEIDAGTAELLTHEQLCKAVARKKWQPHNNSYRRNYLIMR